MIKLILSVFFFWMLGLNFCSAQGSYLQDFDGNDTSSYYSLSIDLDTSSQNVWQIGSPHKQYFNSAFSPPNVIVTDTTLPYPVNNTSTFSFSVPPANYELYGGFALQWVQKLDMDSGRDGGVVEVSIDNGNSWQNAFQAPYIYDYYGYNIPNVGIIATGDKAFTGTDTSWQDIWLCIDTFLSPSNRVYFRFTLKSDSINTNQEGWMIDNISAHITVIHPVVEVNNDKYLKVFPRMTNGPVNIYNNASDNNLILQNADLINESGQLVQHFKIGPGNSQVNIGAQQSGWYFLRVRTNSIVKTYSIFLNKN